MKVMNFMGYSDAAHGWLRVKSSDIIKFNLEDKISRFSYMTDKYVYLEEDCDAGLFLAELDKLLIAYIIKNSYTEYSPIRNYGTYNADYLSGLNVGDTIFIAEGRAEVVEITSKDYIVQTQYTKYRLPRKNFSDYLLQEVSPF